MMRKKIAIAFIVAVLPLCSCVQAPDTSATVNKEQSDRVEYLQQNFKQLYSTDYDRFWKILREAATSATECKAITNTAHFLELARMDSTNAEFNEFFNKEIEQLAVHKTKCFLSALYDTDEKTQTGMLKRLQHPLFVEPANLSQALKPFAQGKYGGFVNRYLGSQ